MDAVIRSLRETDRPLGPPPAGRPRRPGFWSFDERRRRAVLRRRDRRARGRRAARPPRAGRRRRRATGARVFCASGRRRRESCRSTCASSPSRLDARRGGLASRLLARAEAEACALGARTAFAFGWLPAGRPEPDAVPFYAAAGYTARGRHRRLLRAEQRRVRSALPLLRRAAVPLRRASVRQAAGAGRGLTIGPRLPAGRAPIPARSARSALSAPRCPATTCAACRPTRGRRATRRCRSAGRAARSAAPRGCS